MNAGSDFNVYLHLRIYEALKAVMEDDYSVWIQMNKDEVFEKTMKKLRGQCNPTVLKELINDL